MTVEPSPDRKTPWLLIALGVLGVLCLCACVIGIAILFYLTPVQSSSTPTIVTEVILEPTAVLLTPAAAEETQGSTGPSLPEAAPAGTPVDIGNDMTLTILQVRRPVDDVVANGNSLNSAAPEGEEFIQVDVEVTCNSAPGTQCSFYPTVMKAILSDGSRRDLQTFIEGVEDWDTTIELEGGATEQGFLLFIVPSAETALIVSYNDIDTDEPVYLQLP